MNGNAYLYGQLLDLVTRSVLKSKKKYYINNFFALTHIQMKVTWQWVYRYMLTRLDVG